MRRTLALAALLASLWCGASATGQPADAKKPAVDQFGDPLPIGAVARLGTDRLKHAGEVQALAFSPDGKLLASGGADVVIRLWDVVSGKEVRQILGHTEAVRTLAFLPASKDKPARVLVSGSQDGAIRLWNIDDGKELGTIEHPGPVVTLAVSADGKTAASAGVDLEEPHIFLWRLPDGKELRRWKAHGGGVSALAFSRDGKRLASGGVARAPAPPDVEEKEKEKEKEKGKDKEKTDEGYSLAIWDADSGERLQTFPLYDDSVRGVVFSPDGKVLISTGTHRTKGRCVRLWHATTGKELRQLEDQGGHSLDATCLALSPSGKMLAAAEFNRILCWNAEGGSTPFSLLHPHQVQVNALAFSPDGKVLASAGQEGGIALWDIARRAPRLAFPTHRRQVTSVAVAPDGKTIATGSADGTARLWDRAGKELRVFKHEAYLGGGLVWSVAFSPDGKTIALAHHNGSITFWDPGTGQMTRHVKQDFCRQNYVGFSGDGRWLVSNSLDGWEVSLWEASTGKEARQLSRGKDRGVMAAISADGELVASTARGSGDLYVWGAGDGKLLYKQPKAGLAVTFCPVGLLLATAGSKIQIWEAATGTELAVLKEESKFGWKSLAFSPDGRLLAFAEEDRAFLTDVASRHIFHELAGHRLKLTALAFTPDGTHLVTGSDDGSALVWDVSEGNRWRADKAEPLAADLPGLWAALRSPDRLRAYPAYLRLRQTPPLTTDFLTKQLQPLQPVPAERIDKWVQELNSQVFAVRNKAFEELEKLAELAEEPLRQAAKKKELSVETSQRLEKLLARLGNSPEANRQQWALRLLEGFKTAEARKLLEQLAGGAPQAQLTREAQACLVRLQRFKTP